MASPPIEPERALEIVLGEVAPLPSETVPLEDCLDRATARELRSGVAVPPFDNSAMDGYALRSADTAEPRPLRIVEESRAGHPAVRGPGAGEAVRISTGAAIPPGADVVVPIEEASERAGGSDPPGGDDSFGDSTAGEGWVTPARAIAPGENVRRAGEDVACGDVVLGAGRRLGPAELGLLAATGVSEVECAQIPRVALLSSGDELVSPGLPLGPGQIYDSNRHSLRAQAQRAGAEAIDGGVIADDAQATRGAIAAALGADVVVVAGGVSVGRHDHVKGAFAALGVQQRFWRVALRPGGPTWFGTLEREDGRRRTLVFGLPGNPVSALVTFRLFVQPALLALSGLDPSAGRVSVVLAEDFAKKPGRAHYLRCRLQAERDGWHAHLTTARQGSHVLSSMLGADALAVISAEREQVKAGERVEALLL